MQNATCLSFVSGNEASIFVVVKCVSNFHFAQRGSANNAKRVKV